MLNFYCISVEGIDKTGKELIRKYLDILGKHKYVLMDRGIISNVAYAKLWHRPYSYELSVFKDWLFVYLTTDKEDWEVRCKLTNEPKIDYDLNKSIFDETVNEFVKLGFQTLTFNTSQMTPYSIAKAIITYMESYEQNRKVELENGKDCACQTQLIG